MVFFLFVNSNSCLGSNGENPAPCSKLRLEVDQEADELLGAVHAQTVSDTSQPYLSTVLFGSSYDGLNRNPSPRPLHERMKKSSSGPRSDNVFGNYYIDAKDSNKAREGELEDLDDLAPGWEFNDGFEWEHQPHVADDDDEVNFLSIFSY